MNNDFLNWPFGEREGTGVDHDKLVRAHDIWRHAKNRIDGSHSEFDKVDCILSLKRSVNSRLKTLDKEYELDKLPKTRSKKQVLEKYKDYGLIRPTFLKDLFELRNLLEHEDIAPPSTDKCNYYVDIVWYFLKSTDSLLQMKIDCITYDNDEGEIHVDFTQNKTWKVRFYGEIPSHFISEIKVDGWVELDNFEVNKRLNEKGFIAFSGTPKVNNEILLSLARDYFGAAGYWYEDHA